MRIRPSNLIWISILLMAPELGNFLDHSCPSGWFDCGNGRCVAHFFVCDGDDDCDNLQDEMDCPGHEDTTCERHQFKCKDTNRCIPGIWKCDGHADCTDLSDESDCKSNVSCGGGYLCPENKCIPAAWRCDGQWDCEEGLDEKDCDKMKRDCTEHEFRCNDSTCIPLAKACDFKNDCKNGDDEGNHCVEKACQNMTCAHECFLTPAGPECACRDGYKLDKDGKSCDDIDECSLTPSPCSQNCFNTKGSFSCTCKAGYNLVYKTICSVSGPSPLLLFATSHEIRGVWTRPQDYFRVASTRNTAIGVSYDSLESRVYWVESGNKGGAIMVADIDGKNKQVVMTKGLQNPQDIAVDYIARNLYITDQKLQQVLVCKMDGSVCATLLTGDKPRGLAIDHRNELLYWSDWGETKSGIYRSEMDGRNNTLFVKDGVFWPNGLSIDIPTDRLYWCEAKFERIEYITLDGKERKVVLEAVRLHPYYVAVFEDTLYFSDWNKYSLESCNKRTGKNQTTLFRGQNKRVAGVHVFHPIDYANERNPCWDESCSHLCLISRKSYGYACACPTGYQLDKDRSTCIPLRNTSFLLAAEDNLIFHVHPEAVGESIVTQLPTRRLVTVGDMAFDWSTQTLYISDLEKRAIFKMNTSIYAISAFVSKGLDTVEGLDYDWIGNNLYWTDAGTGTVEVITRDGNTRTTIVDGLSRPLDVVVCPDKGVLFIAESSFESKIIMCHMDGQDCQTMVDLNLGTPTTLSVNLWASRLMWADPKNGVIESTNLKGMDRVKNLRRKGPVMSVSYSASFIFWTDTNSHGVHYARTEDDSVQGFINLPHEHNGTEVIKIAYFSAPPDSRGSVCSVRNGGCSHMCLTNPLGYVCACGFRMELSKNSHTCQNKTVPGCRSGEFLCGSGECIQNELVCDDHDDCHDKSDENTTTCHTGCPADEFECANSQCIISKWRCDGQNDCGDNSDEKDCPKPSTCKEDEFLCVKEGKCIPKIWVCDGDSDCTDESDEGPDCKDVTCGPTETRCRDGTCSPTNWFCDGEKDCKDGSDEDESRCGHVVKTCKSDEFTCGNGFCLDKVMVCDRRQDCADGADESDCPTPIGDCRPEEFKCPEDLCINNRSRCDGFEDCRHGEDEKDCETTILDCKSFEFQCKTDKCILKSALCDGVDDCGDNEDETLRKCLRMSTKSPIIPIEQCPEFKCDNGDCVLWSQVCDGNEDCYDLSDEGRRCGVSCTHGNGGCAQNCRDTPVGVICSCHDGFVLMEDDKACKDLDECLTPGHCSQRCTNKKGGYKCTCVEGYDLSADGQRCKATGEREVLMVQTFDSIRELTLYGGQHLVQGTGTDIRGMDFDADSNAIFWTETSNGVINSLTDKTTFAVISKNLNLPALLAYDWIGKNFYFTSGTNVDVCRRDGKVCGNVLNIEHTAHSFALNPIEGLMFWSVWSELTKTETGIVARANMDGSEKSVIASKKVSWPSGLTVDIVMSKLYWTDLRLSTIEVSDFDGYNRKVLVNIGLQHPQSMTLFEDSLYWSNWGSKQIVRGNKFTGGAQITMEWEDIKAYGLKMVHKVLQPKPHDPCSKAKCDQLCLLRANGYKCDCGYGYALDDSNTCVSRLVNKTETGKITADQVCASNYCLNGGLCSVEDDGPYCSCLVSYHGVRCEYIVKNAPVQQSDLTWVAGVVLGLLLVTLVVVGVFLLWRRHGQRIRGTIGDGISVSFKNQLFSRGGEMDLDQASQETQSGEEISMSKDGVYTSENDQSKVTEEGGIYRWPSSESVGDSASAKDNLGLLSGKKSSQPETFRRFFQRN